MPSWSLALRPSQPMSGTAGPRDCTQHNIHASSTTKNCSTSHIRSLRKLIPALSLTRSPIYLVWIAPRHWLVQFPQINSRSTESHRKGFPFPKQNHKSFQNRAVCFLSNLVFLSVASTLTSVRLISHIFQKPWAANTSVAHNTWQVCVYNVNYFSCTRYFQNCKQR